MSLKYLWKSEHKEMFNNVTDLSEQAGRVPHPMDEHEMCLLTHDCDSHWGVTVTQSPLEGCGNETKSAKVSLTFTILECLTSGISDTTRGHFQGGQTRVSTSWREHRNLMYVFDHKSRGSDFKNPGDELCRWVPKVYRILRILVLDHQTYYSVGKHKVLKKSCEFLQRGRCTKKASNRHHPRSSESRRKL